jgi:hydrogenase small subunit
MHRWAHLAERFCKRCRLPPKAVICWGSCACNGCVQSAKPNPTGSHSDPQTRVRGVPIIKVPGCPPIGEVMAGVLVHLITFGTLPELDRMWTVRKRSIPRRVHDTCYRRPFYDAGLFVESLRR